MRRAITIRVPQAWQTEVNSERVGAWLKAFLSCPFHLPEDPGPGDAMIRLSIPAEPLRHLIKKMRCSTSKALRRLLAANLRTVRASSLEDPSACATGPLEASLVEERGDDPSLVLSPLEWQRRTFLRG